MDSIFSPHYHASSTETTENDEQETRSKIKHAMSLLPKEKGLAAFELYQYQGFWFASAILENVMLAQEKFLAKPTDVFICSTMKAGTTWLRALCFAIYTRAHYDDSSNPLLIKSPHECVPHLDLNLTQIINTRKDDECGSGLPLICTHMPFTFLPKSIIQEGCKIIYICRDPKDTFISMWYFINKIRKVKGIELIPIKEALDFFCKGLSSYGSFWDHVLGYWSASLKNPDKILFLKYEDVMKETDFHVKKLANFMGCPFCREEEMEGMVEKIVRLCSFSNLSNLEVNKNGNRLLFDIPNAIEHKIYFRKGEIGDWKNHLVEEDAAYFDAITEEKFEGTGLILHQHG